MDQLLSMPRRLALLEAPYKKRAVAYSAQKWRAREAQVAFADGDSWSSYIVGGWLKRAVDVFLSAIALVFLAPLLATIAVLIRAQDGGPALFCHSRIGQRQRSFKCFKFRSMYVNSDELFKRRMEISPADAAEWERTQKLRDDPRVTPIGAFLRKTSLDELPQLFNILRGEMSLVGPRPVVSAELERYGLDRLHYLRSRPGLTGVWQVSGRNEVSYEDRVAMDKDYALHWSMARDLFIIAATVPAVLTSRGTY